MDFLLDWIPLWVWIVLAAAALFAAWNFLGTRGMLAALAAIGTLGAYRRGRQKGQEDAEAKRRRERVESIEAAKKIDDDIAGNDPAKNREELGKWGKQ